MDEVSFESGETQVHMRKKRGAYELPKSLIQSARVCGLRFERIGRLDLVLLMIDGENPSAVDLHINVSLVPERKPETIDSLILPDEVRSIDPERWFLRRVSRDFHHRKIFRIDPNFAFE